MLLRCFSNSAVLCVLLLYTATSCTSKKLPSCGLKKYECRSGQCIRDNRVCDGIPDCLDSSDETADVCGNLPCPSKSYRCDYGACVKPNARCDDIKDCYDGSDEQWCSSNPVPPQPLTTTTTTTAPTTRKTTTTATPPTTTPRPKITVNCLKPNNPSNGQYTIASQESHAPGDIVQQFSVLLTTCNYGYEASPDYTFSVCANGIWTPLPPKCSH